MKKMLITATLVALLVAVFATTTFAVTERTCKN